LEVIDMTDKKVSVNVAPQLGTMLLVLFIGLKLTGNIAWSWLWVLSPFWIPLGLLLVSLLVGFIAAVLGGDT
jgi:hypothetical protein